MIPWGQSHQSQLMISFLLSAWPTPPQHIHVALLRPQVAPDQEGHQEQPACWSMAFPDASGEDDSLKGRDEAKREGDGTPHSTYFLSSHLFKTPGYLVHVS